MKEKKRVLSWFLVLVMVLTAVPFGIMPVKAATSFSPRLYAPDRSGYYANYWSNNCVRYVACRANEILGYEHYPVQWPIGTTSYYESWYSQSFAKSTSEPRPGSIIVAAGHVAIVEEVHLSENYIIVSEGHSYTTPSELEKNGAVLFDKVQNGPGGTNTEGSRPGTWFESRKVWLSNGKPTSGFGGGTFYGYVYLLTGSAVISDPVTPTPTPSPDPLSTGTYRCHTDIGVRLRSSASLSGGILLVIPNGAEIQVTQTTVNGNIQWGKTTYNGQTGWTALSEGSRTYYEKITVPNPSTPSLNSVPSDVAKGANVTVTWNAAANASRYAVSINGGSEINVGSATSYSFTANEARTYSVKVKAYNSVGVGSGWSAERRMTAHDQVTVTFKNWNGDTIQSVRINWGESTTPPSAPARKGYTFQRWDGQYTGVKSNSTVTAVYSVNYYSVRFFDKDNKQIGETQKVAYGQNATPPDPNTPTGYEFVSWDSMAYQNVYTDASNKTINIRGIYKWQNDDLPIVCSDVTARRIQEGYYVSYKLTNHPSSVTTGRAIIALKTTEDKLITMTESSAFYVNKNSSKTVTDEFIKCDQVATRVEITIVDDYSSGVPISQTVSCSNIENVNLWSNWSTQMPSGEYETKTQYRYRTKETSTGNTKTKSGCTYSGTYSTRTESGQTTSAISSFETESQKRVVTTTFTDNYASKTQYKYSRYTGTYGGSRRYGPTYSSISWCSNVTYEETGWMDSSYAYAGESSAGGAMYSGYWYNQQTQTVSYKTGTTTVYHYTDTFYTYNFYRWSAYSDWSDTPVSATSTRDVDTRTMYRKSNGGVEDTSGEWIRVASKYSGVFDYYNDKYTMRLLKESAKSNKTIWRRDI